MLHVHLAGLVFFKKNHKAELLFGCKSGGEFGVLRLSTFVSRFFPVLLPSGLGLPSPNI